jgi:chromo domain-containing protein 1
MAQQTVPDFDHDAISLTSTPPSSEYGSDHEFLVEEILAEKKVDGRLFYLVSWDGYAIHKATWEPKSNIHSDPLLGWKERKKAIERGEKAPFNVVAYESDLLEIARAKKLRHRIRKIKRKNHGNYVAPNASDSDSSEAVWEKAQVEDGSGTKSTALKGYTSQAGPPNWTHDDDRTLLAALARGMSYPKIQKENFPSRTAEACRKRYSRLTAAPNATNDIDSDSSEAMEDDSPSDMLGKAPRSSGSNWNDQDDQILQAAREKGVSFPEIQRTHFPTRTPKACRSRHLKIKGALSNTDDYSEEDTNLTSHKVTRKRWNKPDDQTLITALANGMSYQEVQRAHFPSRTLLGITKRYYKLVDQGATTNRDIAPASTSIKIVSTANNPLDMPSAGRGKSAKRGGSFGLPQNVFTGGSSRKQRGNLIEHASDPTKVQKHFSNMRLQNKAHIQARNKADAPPDPEAVGGLYNPSNPTKLPPMRPTTLQRNSSLKTTPQSNTPNIENIPRDDLRPRETHSRSPPVQREISSARRLSEEATPRAVQGLPPGTLTCFFWHTTRSCTRGYQCRYLHEDIPGLAVAPHPRANMPCKNFMNGYCPRGNACMFLHPSGTDTSKDDYSTSSVTNLADNNPNELFLADSPVQLVNGLEIVDHLRPKRTVSFAFDETVSPHSESKDTLPSQTTTLQENDFESGSVRPPRKTVSLSDARPSLSSKQLKLFDQVCMYWSGAKGKNGCNNGKRCKFNHFQGDAPLVEPTYKGNEYRPAAPEGETTPSHQTYKEPPSYEQYPSPAHQLTDTSILDSFAPIPSPASATIALPKVIRSKVSMDDYRRKKAFKALGLAAKEIFFGSEAAESIMLGFAGVEHALQSAWGTSFTALPHLHFDQMCTAQDFVSQYGALATEVLWQGNINADPTDSSASMTLDKVSQQLRLIPGGLISTSNSFVILLYPPAEEWKVPSPADLSNDAALRYLIFETNAQLSGQLHAPAFDYSSNQFLRTLARNIHKLSFTKLLPKPTKPVKDKAYHFYLLFPESANQTAQFISSWLTASYSSKFCKIYSSQTEGSWDYFVNSPEIEHGIVLVHSSVIAYVSELPGLLKLFATRPDTFWYINDSGSLYPLFDAPIGSTLGQTTATRLLSHGQAILLTPSLLVADPDRALQLIRWFRTKLTTPTRCTYKLICTHNISNYLLNLALDKSLERDAFLLKYRDDPKKDAMELSVGLTWKMCQQRFTCHEEMGQLLSQDVTDGYSTFHNADNPAEPYSPVVYADELIDPDDEQALVTWFAGWAVTKLDQFRRFTVVGTSNASRRRAVRSKEVLEIVPAIESPTNLADLPVSARSPVSHTGDSMDLDIGNVQDDTAQQQETAQPAPAEGRLVTREVKFEATSEWYGRLKTEGKGWEHVYVDGWEKCFKYLCVK